MIPRTEQEHQERSYRLSTYIQQLIASGCTRAQAYVIIANQYDFGCDADLIQYINTYK